MSSNNSSVSSPVSAPETTDKATVVVADFGGFVFYMDKEDARKFELLKQIRELYPRLEKASFSLNCLEEKIFEATTREDVDFMYPIGELPNMVSVSLIDGILHYVSLKPAGVTTTQGE